MKMQHKLLRTKRITHLIKDSCVQAKRGSGNVGHSMISCYLRELISNDLFAYTVIIQPATALCLRELCLVGFLRAFIFQPALHFSKNFFCGNKKKYYLCSDIRPRIKRTFL
jgi:hypothetical protein